jgi:hypothetical protein
MEIAMIVGRALGPTSGWLSETVVKILKMHGMESFWTKVRHMPSAACQKASFAYPMEQ